MPFDSADSGTHVIVGCFSRGGSSLVWNILASHPRLASPGVETHQIFLGRPATHNRADRAKTNIAHAIRGGGLPRPRVSSGHVLVNAGLFEPTNLSRRDIPGSLHDGVRERILSAPRLIAPAVDPALVDPSPRGLTAGVVLKSINGVVFLTPSLRSILGSVTPVLLVRDGYALCESRLRRGTFSDASKFGLVFRTIVEEMRRQVRELPSTVVVCFEDLLAEPVRFAQHLYRSVGLDPTEVTEVRLKAKTHLGEGGDRASSHRPGSHFTVPMVELASVITSSVDDLQTSRLSVGDRHRFESTAGEALEWLEELRSQSRVS